MPTDAEAVLVAGWSSRSGCISRWGAESCRAGTRGPARRPARGYAVMVSPLAAEELRASSASRLASVEAGGAGRDFVPVGSSRDMLIADHQRVPAGGLLTH